MDEDLISDNFSDSVDKTMVRKVIVVIKILLILSIVYSCLELLEWYPYLFKNISGNLNYEAIFNYRIVPYILLLTLLLNIISLVFYLKGNKLIVLSFVHNEPELFNLGYGNCYKSGLITAIDFAIGIMIILLRLILKR
jgi:hypothetical protein